METAETNLSEDSKLEELYQLLEDKKEAEFLQCDNLSNYANQVIRGHTLLHRAATKGLSKAVEKLIYEGARQIPSAKFGCLPIELAGRQGFHKIFEILLLQDSASKVPDRLLLQLLKHADAPITNEDVDYNRCLDVWFQNRNDINVNVHGRKIKNTPLHFAVRYAKPEHVTELLARGASLISENMYGERPIDDISASYLESHLNACVRWDKAKDENINEDDREFVVTFNYKTLVPTEKIQNSKFNSERADPELGKLTTSKCCQFCLETQVISSISKIPDLKYLLMHPLITSFLYMKWYRVRWFFYINFLFYITFCTSLILYILVMNYYGERELIVTHILSIVLGATFAVLATREVLQFAVSPKKYVLNFENWLELSLIILTALTIFQKSNSDDLSKQESAAAILLAAIELLLLIGQHPKMSTNIEMLRTVSINFFKSLLWYFILIFAFSLSFYILFRTNPTSVQEQNPNNSSSCCDEVEKPDFFVNPLISLFKTIIMLTGEFDSSSLNFQSYPITSHVIFLLFVFMVGIILFNLLNGLAVSDTQLIKNNAELIGHITRIEHVSYIECMLLGEILPTGVLKMMRSCCRGLRLRNILLPRILLEHVCLFPNFLENYKMSIYPNQQAEVMWEGTAMKKHVKICLDKQTTRRTQNLVKDKKEKTKMKQLKHIILAKQEQQEVLIKKLTEEQQLVLVKLDKILNGCSTFESEA